MKIGKTYKLSLIKAFGGYVTLDNVILRGKVDLTVALGISSVIDEYNQIAHLLDDELANLDLTEEEWYYFATFGDVEKIVVPKSFVLENTITELESVEKTLEIRFTSQEQYRALVDYLTDYAIVYNEVGSV